MIVKADGSVESLSTSCGSASKIVAATGTAYVKRGKIKAIVRVIRRVFSVIKKFFKKFTDNLFVLKLSTKSGIPTSIAPPSKYHTVL